MTMDYKTATVFGGTGFVGTQVVRELAARGYRVKVASRVPERAFFLRTCGTVGQVVPWGCDYNEESIAAAVAGSDVVVNCIGILYERRKKCRFTWAHVEIPGMIAKAAKKAGVSDFVHISALGIEKSAARYAKSKLEGEKAVWSGFPGAVVLRPSVIFGEGDEFFNMFARITSILPAFVPLPLIGGGKTRFQPVFVGDVADAVVAAIENQNARGKIYELGGPDMLSFKGVYETVFAYIGRRQALMKVPFGLAKIQAFFLSMLPKPLLTGDQVELLKSDNVVNAGALDLMALGVRPTAMESVLPGYLGSYRPGGKFADLEAA